MGAYVLDSSEVRYLKIDDSFLKSPKWLGDSYIMLVDGVLGPYRWSELGPFFLPIYLFYVYGLGIIFLDFN